MEIITLFIITWLLTTSLTGLYRKHRLGPEPEANIGGPISPLLGYFSFEATASTLNLWMVTHLSANRGPSYLTPVFNGNWCFQLGIKLVSVQLKYYMYSVEFFFKYQLPQFFLHVARIF